MPTNDNTYISAQDPIIDGDTKLVSRNWFRFFEMLARKIKLWDGPDATTATTGSAGVLPAQPAGYFIITDSNGEVRKVPYYNA